MPLRVLYNGNRSFCNINGVSKFIFNILSGVLQGCPLSGTLFVIVMDPIMFLFTKYICSPGFGQVRACADDIGAVLYNLKDLVRVFHIFSIVGKASGLLLKPIKCVLILLSHLATEHNIACIKAWLRANIPAWDNFLVTNLAKYLGFYLGPRAATLQWAGPIAKFKDKSNFIYNSRLPHWLALREYSSKCVSVLLYVGQLVPPPKNLRALEATSVSKILGFATNSLCFDSVFTLDEFECLKFPRPTYSVCAARVRACTKTVKRFVEYSRHLQEMMVDCLPLALCFGECFSPGWDSLPFCIHLNSAYNGKLGSGCCKVPDSSILELIRKFEAKPFARFQGVIYDNIYKHQLPNANHWHGLIERRLNTFGLPNPNVEFFSSNLKATLASLSSKSRKGHSLMFVKTIVNSWSTSYRYHEPDRLPCIFGCEGCKDNLEHYLVCDVLWAAACSALVLDSGWLNLSFPQRLGFPCPHINHIYLNTVMFKTYHCLRKDFCQMITLSVSDKDFSDIQGRTFFLAAHFASEIDR